MGELIDHHSRTATSSDTEFAPSQMADVWRLELTAIKVDGGIDLLVTDEPGNFSRYLHTVGAPITNRSPDKWEGTVADAAGDDSWPIGNDQCHAGSGSRGAIRHIGARSRAKIS
jgi:hypothetical protein